MNVKPNIFLAHSQLDLHRARQVRNLFEDLGHDVLLLKLSQQMTEDYLRQLLTREIQARDWLVVLRSANTDKSMWVGYEQERAKGDRKPFFVVDLARCEGGPDRAPPQDVDACLRASVLNISRDIRVFISYSRVDEPHAHRIRADLEARGYEVSFELDRLDPGEEIWPLLKGALDAAVRKGAVVLLASPSALRSAWVAHELDYALGHQGTVIPCLLGDLPAAQMPPGCQGLRWIRFTPHYEAGLAELVQSLQRRGADAPSP